VIMDWLAWLERYWDSVDFGAYNQTGEIVFETHIYTGTANSQQEARDAAARDIESYKTLGTRRRIFLGEWSVTGNRHVDYNQLASWYVSQANQFGEGSFIWNFDGPWAWGGVVPLNLEWPKIFEGGPMHRKGSGAKARMLYAHSSLHNGNSLDALAGAGSDFPYGYRRLLGSLASPVPRQVLFFLYVLAFCLCIALLCVLGFVWRLLARLEASSSPEGTCSSTVSGSYFQGQAKGPLGPKSLAGPPRVDFPAASLS